jgi:hypothetical protein
MIGDFCSFLSEINDFNRHVFFYFAQLNGWRRACGSFHKNQKVQFRNSAKLKVQLNIV